MVVTPLAGYMGGVGVILVVGYSPLPILSIHAILQPYYYRRRLIRSLFEEVVGNQEKDIQRRYLNQVLQDTELLTLKGIPAGLISESVHLDEVFIPLQFRLNRPRADYPLTEKELEKYRELRSVGKLSAE